jgi:hypothetical protein
MPTLSRANFSFGRIAHMAEVKDYSFTLIVGNVGELSNEVEDALFVAGCDDATLSMQHGLLCIDFTRQAQSFEAAILSAIGDVKQAGIGAEVLRVDECAIVTQAEIARKIGHTRQLVAQYISGKRGSGAFPPPAYRLVDGPPVWVWSDVGHWLSKNNLLAAEEFHNATVTATINRLLENMRQEREQPLLVRQISAYLAEHYPASFNPSVPEFPERMIAQTSTAGQYWITEESTGYAKKESPIQPRDRFSSRAEATCPGT